MERHKCKLCSRTFVNGRALGGHMKAHLATLPLPPKPQPSTQSPSFSYSSSESESEHEIEEEEEEKALIYVLRENPKKSIRIADPEFSFAPADTAGSVVQDRESETESKNPTRKRSKRNRKPSLVVGYQNQNLEPKKQRFMASTPPPTTTEPEPVSSVSDTSPEEDVAMCLMMLSRDKWKRKNNVVKEEEEDEQEEEQGSVEKMKMKMKMKRVRGKQVCEKCGKAFRSSRALGSHRSVCCGGGDEGNVDVNHNKNDNKIFECPFCFKVFGSGQALGGHKRSHLIPSSSSTANANPSSATTTLKLRESFIDLNLPAPPEDDDLSVVSDA